jgi:hypothetical protein
MAFPTSFAEQVEILEPGIGQRGDAALARLQDKGFIVGTGLTRYFAGAIGVMGYQKHIREDFCPRDATKARFATEASTAAWLQKNGGRGMFLLLDGLVPEDALLDAYGWTGFEENPNLPDHPITSAYRLGERALGQHLSKDFIQVVVSGTNTLYAPGEGIGLETWSKNVKAVHSYRDVGFEQIARTYDEEQDDYRLFMGYPPELLAT